jgi:uncharacterized protein YcbX
VTGAAIRLGVVRNLLRYPVKSMAGTPLESAYLGWHGFAGDRRFAFRRVADESGFPGDVMVARFAWCAPRL